jgi:hypothetical protein
METEEMVISALNDILSPQKIHQLRNLTIKEKREVISTNEKLKDDKLSTLTDDEIEEKFDVILEKSEQLLNDILFKISIQSANRQTEEYGLIMDEYELEIFKNNLAHEVFYGNLSEKELNQIINLLGEMINNKNNIKITKYPIFKFNGKPHTVDKFTGSLNEIKEFISDSEDIIVLYLVRKSNNIPLFDLEYWRNE